MNRSEVQQIKITSRRVERMLKDELEYALECEEAISDWMAEPFKDESDDMISDIIAQFIE